MPNNSKAEIQWFSRTSNNSEFRNPKTKCPQRRSTSQVMQILRVVGPSHLGWARTTL
ncbi:unnamed protein product [Staurois parvus]|uniref:Uncharacterized protein n=1 Tax=Staurois parvus TaxID=386267 RepID=A0ABN9G5D7_9NEOB|nr:unnamed protein product [Staurois parvus]